MMAKRRGPAAPGAVKQITSLANPIVKDIRGLALAKNRKASGLFVAEGLKLVADAVEAGWTIRTLVHASAVAGQPLVRRLAATDPRQRRHGARGQRGGARQDQPARQPADRARRLRAAR